jgi:hypothetical protein
MYERVFRSQRYGDSGLVSSKLSIEGRQPGPHSTPFRRGKLVLALLGCAFLNGACADDSTDNTQHRKHRHGSGHGREQVETVDRSRDSNNSSPTPAPAW